MKSRPENKWFKTLYLEFVNFRFSGWKPQTQQKLAKMIIHLTSFAQKTSFILQTSTHLPLLTQPKVFLYKFTSKYVFACCQQKHLHWTISRHSRTAFLKHLQSKCMYILVRKIFCSRYVESFYRGWIISLWWLAVWAW